MLSLSKRWDPTTVKELIRLRSNKTTRTILKNLKKEPKNLRLPKSKQKSTKKPGNTRENSTPSMVYFTMMMARDIFLMVLQLEVSTNIWKWKTNPRKANILLENIEMRENSKLKKNWLLLQLKKRLKQPLLSTRKDGTSSMAAFTTMTALKSYQMVHLLVESINS